MSKKVNPTARSIQPPSKKNINGLSANRIAIFLALFGFVLYMNTLGHSYVMDDGLIFEANSKVQNGFTGILDIFTQPYREQCFGGCLYRPLTLSIFNLEWMISPHNPFIGHLMNVLWYSATGVLLFFTLRKLMPEQKTMFPLIACLLFIAHPVHTEVVANIKSRDEILSLFFILVSIRQFANWHISRQWKSIFFAALSFLAALLSKEGAITALAVFPFIGWIFFQKSFVSSLKSSWWLLIPIGLFFLMRGYAFHGLTAPPTNLFDNPLVAAQGSERIGTSFLILYKYFLLLVFPLHLVSDYSYNAVPLQSLVSPASIAGIVIYAALGVYAVFGLIKKRIGGFFASAFLSSISLYSQLFFLIGAFIAERFLYLPSLWFILGAAFSLTVFLNTNNNSISPSQYWQNASLAQRSILVGLVGILIWFSAHTIIRNRDWVSDYVLMKTDAASLPNSIRLTEGYAEEVFRSIAVGSITPEELKHRLDYSEQLSKQTIAIKPGVSAYSNLAKISIQRHNYDEAMSYYLKIKDISDDKTPAIQNIVNMYIFWAKEEGDKNNNIERSLDLLNRALEYNPGDGEIYHGIGLNYYRLGKLEETRIALEKAYSLSPGSASIKSDLYKFYLSQGMNDKAAALQ